MFFHLEKLLLTLPLFMQEDCGGVSAGLWYDLINSLGMGVACFMPDMEHQAVVQTIRDYMQHQTRLSQEMVCIDALLIITRTWKYNIACKPFPFAFTTSNCKISY